MILNVEMIAGRCASTSLVIGAAYSWIDEPALATRTLGRAADVAGELGAPVLQAWARLLRSTTAVRQGEPEVERQVANAVRAATGLGLLHTAEIVQAVTMRAGRATNRRPTEVTSSAVVRSSDRAQPSAVITLRCLGGFSLATRGIDVPWRLLRPRVRALLMLLAMNHGRQLHREQIIDALWPDAALASGIRSLQVAVSSIRQCLNAGGITEDALRRHGTRTHWSCRRPLIN